VSRCGVIVVGDVVVDVLARALEPAAVGSDASARVRATGGGSGGNVAAWLAGTGVGVTLVARVGDDLFGRDQRAQLQAAGVDCRLATDDALPTGAVVVIVTPDGERTMYPDRGANLALTAADVDQAPFDTAAHLHVAGYALLADGSRPAALHAIRRAREQRMSVSVDPSSAQPLRAAGAAAFLDWTRGVGTCLPNLQEVRVLTDCNEPREAIRLLAEAYPEVVVTLGADGALWTDGTEVLHCAAATVPPDLDSIDSTGAGDAFTAGWVAARLRGAGVQTGLAAATDLAATALSTRGGRPPVAG
jgi:sugar/nucleoside kinase (ribokinase family)